MIVGDHDGGNFALCEFFALFGNGDGILVCFPVGGKTLAGLLRCVLLVIIKSLILIVVKALLWLLTIIKSFYLETII
jgi:hypothetical protein